jgi:NADH dehydrogenase
MTRIVILGGGFAGITTARQLGRVTRRNPAIDVHLVNNENYFVFQPLLPEVVSCNIEPGHVLSPIRQLCPGVQFHCAGVRQVDRQRKTVTLVGTDERRSMLLEYDHLVWCLGLVMDLSRVPGMAEHAFPMKTLGDAFRVRNHVLGRLEEADQEPDGAVRDRMLTVVTVGGGFSGVETMAAVNDMIRSVLKYYPNAAAGKRRMVLVHAGDRVLPELDGDAAGFAQAKLRERGVEVLLNRIVTEATEDGVTLSDGSTISAGTVICTVGNVPHPLVSKTGFPATRGRVIVDEMLRVQGEEHCWAVGDAALVPDSRGGFCPTTAQYAMREGVLCADNILATIENRPLHAFQFRGLGQLTMVGRHAGAGKVFGLKLSGFIPWYLWRSVYLAKMPGLRSKVRIAMDWTLELLFPQDITMINVKQTEQLKRAHFRQGELIIREGEVADHFYLIESGEVEIVHEEPGGHAQRLGIRRAGTSFGEIGLLNGVPRTATVRCLTAVDVIKLSRQDFLSLVKNHEVIGGIVEREARRIHEREHVKDKG